MKDYVFIAKMDSNGRVRVPKEARVAKGYVPGKLYEITIREMEDARPC